MYLSDILFDIILPDRRKNVAAEKHGHAGSTNHLKQKTAITNILDLAREHGVELKFLSKHELNELSNHSAHQVQQSASLQPLHGICLDVPTGPGLV